MTERRLFLIRHGQSDFASADFRESPRGRQWDPGLGEEGRRQAELLASRLLTLERHPAAVYSSPFRRCLETIGPYLRAAGIEAAEEEDIGEVFTGEWEGKSFEEIVSADEELARRFRDQEAMFSMSPGGESGPDLRKRVESAIEGIISGHPEGDLVVVAHGGVINAYLGNVLGIHDQDMFFLPENTSVNTVVLSGERRRIRFMNDVRHLTDPGAFK
ncbi:MAG: histidine phosphatase family protein [Actinomycetota bacterium]